VHFQSYVVTQAMSEVLTQRLAVQILAMSIDLG
jgi:hypothetical protein